MSVNKYNVVMMFHETEDIFEINGTVEFEMDVEIPSNKDDLELSAERRAFLNIESSNFGRGSMDFEIKSMDKIEKVDLEILKNALASIDECYNCGCEKPQDSLSLVDDQYYCENCL